VTTETSEYPCVGDWVCIEPGNPAVIHTCLPRKSFIRRKAAGKNIEFQMIAANIDVALIFQSCEFDFNVKRLERYLVMVTEGNIEPLIVLTKTDLVTSDKLAELISRIQDMNIQARIIRLSNVSGDGIDEIRDCMLPRKTYCLVGSSGVGKTTLINHLLHDNVLKTGAVSGTGEGRHTTVRRQLIVLQNGAMLIDTPGMRELGLLGASSGLEQSYQDISFLATQCRFNNCTHETEPGCAVRKALADGTLDEEHYDNYLKLKKESEFNDLSYVEKRKKDKDFGKMVHNVMKHKRKKPYV
jgi:ribosome biogenesis GTPase